MVAISYSADNFIIARILGVADVTVFSIPQRMFAVIATIVTMLMMPLWPAYAEAISRGDMHWVRHTLSRTLLGVFAFTTVVSGLLLLFSNKLLLWWVGPSIHPSFALMLGLAVWAVLSNCGNTLAMFLNGAGILKFQVIVACHLRNRLLAGENSVYPSLWHRRGSLGHHRYIYSFRSSTLRMVRPSSHEADEI